MEYPNLELLEFKAMIYLRRLMQVKDRPIKQRYNFQAQVFPQTWRSTALGFDKSKDGQPTWGGSAMTTAYTTVFRETTEEVYLVFFAGEVCYVVTEPSEKFYSDLKEHELAPLSEADKLY